MWWCNDDAVMQLEWNGYVEICWLVVLTANGNGYLQASLSMCPFVFTSGIRVILAYTCDCCTYCCTHFVPIKCVWATAPVVLLVIMYCSSLMQHPEPGTAVLMADAALLMGHISVFPFVLVSSGCWVKVLSYLRHLRCKFGIQQSRSLSTAVVYQEQKTAIKWDPAINRYTAVVLGASIPRYRGNI